MVGVFVPVCVFPCLLSFCLKRESVYKRETRGRSSSSSGGGGGGGRKRVKKNSKARKKNNKCMFEKMDEGGMRGRRKGDRKRVKWGEEAGKGGKIKQRKRGWERGGKH